MLIRTPDGWDFDWPNREENEDRELNRDLAHQIKGVELSPDRVNVIAPWLQPRERLLRREVNDG